MNTPALRNTAAAIWQRLLQPAGRTLPVVAARSLLELDFLPADKERMRILAGKARNGSLTPAERDEVREYERVGNLLALVKSTARQRLVPTPPAPMSNGAPDATTGKV